jgi:CheY-like chemotaxis protein
MGKTLGDLGHEVSQVANGRQALDSLRSYHPDLLLTDLGMPGMDGRELVRSLGGVGYRGPVLICTGKVDAEKENYGYSGPITFLKKPFLPEGLNQAVNLALSQRVFR